MMENSRECPKCRGRMELGFVVDESRFLRRQSTWAPGAPKKSFWTGLKVKERLPVTVLRCDRCGFLESFAKQV